MKKYISFIAGIILPVLAAVSCSNEEKGAGDITIGFAKDSYRIKEGAGLTKIQIEVSGEAESYPVTFDIQAKVTSDETLQVNDIIHFTQSEGFKIAGKDLAPVYVEFTVKDDDIIADSRFIELSIVNVKGASVATSTATLEIRDNDNNPYDKLMGDWTAHAKDHTGAAQTFPVNISGGFNDSDIANNEGRVLVCWGFGPYQRESSRAPEKQPVWYMDYDEDNRLLKVQNNVLMANMFQFSDLDFECIIRCCGVEPSGDGLAINMLTPLEGTWSSDFNTITFQQGGYGLTAAIFTLDGVYTENVWMIYTDIVLTRNK